MISQLYEVKVDVEPAAEPVLLAETKTFMDVNTTDDDTLITDLIVTARQMAEKYLRRALITQTLIAYYSRLDEKTYVPNPPHQSIGEVKRIKLDDETVLTVNNDYYVQGLDHKYLLIGKPWELPAGHSPRDSFTNYELKVTYIAGYGTAGTDVPKAIRNGIKMIVNTLYDGRDIEGEAQTFKIPTNAKMVMAPYKILI